jgi:hypothetical protein
MPSKKSNLIYRNIGIGLCDDATSLNGMLGFGDGTSYGYHADDGSTYSTRHRSRNQFANSREYGEGATVGCGFDAKESRVYFTKQGKRLGRFPPFVFLIIIILFFDEEFQSFCRRSSWHGQWSRPQSLDLIQGHLLLQLSLLFPKYH